MTKNLRIFYFTGTGNALAVSKWITEIFTKKGVNSEIVKITPSLKISQKEIEKNTLIGFCYPTHGFNAPPVVVDFIFRFPKSGNNIFILNTRAGMKLSRLFMPGLSGLAQLLPALILKLKGYKIVGLQPMDLPSNWISIHPGLRKKVIYSIFLRCEKITNKFAERIISGEKVFKGLRSLPIDMIISPISIGYYFFGRFVLAKTFVAGDNCDGCRICEKQCPVKAIQMKNKRPYWTRKCESCMHCMNICPKQAIQTPHLFVVVIWWLVFSVVPIFLMQKIIPGNVFLNIHYSLFLWIIILITGLPIIFFSYSILHFLLRFSFFNKLISFTSLTRYKFWRRYFAPKNYLNLKK